MLGVTPDPWQREVLRAYGRGERKITVVACHNPGKTAVASWLAAHQLLCRFPQKTAVTAPTGQQMYDAFFAELVTWMRKLPPTLFQLFEIKADSIELKMAPEESFLTARTAKAEQPEALAGIHCEAGWVLLIVDESSGVPEPIFESAKGSMAGPRVTTLLLGNGVRSTGYFYQSHTSFSGWQCFRISGDPADKNKTGEDGVYFSPRVQPDFVRDIIDEYGIDSNAYRIRVQGLFPRADDDTIIPIELVEPARHRDVTPNPFAPVLWGLDVARGGGDLTALCKRKANVITEPIRTWAELRDTMLVVGVVKAEYDRTTLSDRPVEILVDVIGVGAGVCDRLRELGLPARGINVSESPSLLSDRYVNQRTELWFAMRDWFAKRDCRIPMDDKLQYELTGQKSKIVESNGKTMALPKDLMRKVLKRSPDRADALMLTFASDAITMQGGSMGKSWNTPLKRGIKGIV